MKNNFGQIVGSDTGKFKIQYREFDPVNNRDFGAVKTVEREASSDREAKNKISIQFPRCRILSCEEVCK